MGVIGEAVGFIIGSGGGGSSINNPGTQHSRAGYAIGELQLSGEKIKKGSWHFTGLPQGLVGTSEGRIAGLPTEAESPTVTVEATGESGGTISITFTWVVEPFVPITKAFEPQGITVGF